MRWKYAYYFLIVTFLVIIFVCLISISVRMYLNQREPIIIFSVDPPTELSTNADKDYDYYTSDSDNGRKLDSAKTVNDNQNTSRNKSNLNNDEVKNDDHLASNVDNKIIVPNRFLRIAGKNTNQSDDKNHSKDPLSPILDKNTTTSHHISLKADNKTIEVDQHSLFSGRNESNTNQSDDEHHPQDLVSSTPIYNTTTNNNLFPSNTDNKTVEVDQHLLIAGRNGSNTNQSDEEHHSKDLLSSTPINDTRRNESNVEQLNDGNHPKDPVIPPTPIYNEITSDDSGKIAKK